MENIKLSFGGGGGGAGLIAHTHNPSIPQDGGELSSSSPTTVSGLPIAAYATVFG
jgi:hypothetical protein